MTTTVFLRPRLTGARFDEAAVPLEFLKDLAALEELIVEVAKSEFLKEHPDRKRSPKGFTGGIALKLTGVEPGSAVPVISLVLATSTLFPPSNQVYFERARDAVIEAVGAAEHGLPIVDHVPEKALGYFDKIGRSLQDGEAMEFSRGGTQAPARLTRETRKKLLLASSGVNELTEEMTVRGMVPEADQDDMSFEIQLPDGRKVKAPITAPHLDTILEAFNGYKTGVRLLLQGIARFSRSDRLLGFESIEQMNLLDLLDVPSRLEEIGLLRDGWLEGEGKAPSTEGLNWLSRAFDTRYPDDLDPPHLYPTVEGGIQAEWSASPVEATLEIDLARHSGHWHALNMESNSETSFEVDLDKDEGWLRLIEAIKDLASAV